jgi:hypothetical protein
VNTEGLAQFRDENAPKKAPWSLPLSRDFRPGNILAFDPSLSACGFVALSIDDNGITVHEAIKFPNPIVYATGNEENYLKALTLTSEVRRWRCETGFHKFLWPYVHEAPPVGGGRIKSPESALLASLAVRFAMEPMEFRGMITPAAHKKFICGNSKATKQEHHAALAELAKTLPINGYEKITNEAKRDALSIALYYLRNDYGSTQ